MVDLHCNHNLSQNLRVSIPSHTRIDEFSPFKVSSSARSAYERYLSLPGLRDLSSSTDFPGWKNESILKPALHALEITFRLISIALSDPRPYSHHSQWTSRLESLAKSQLGIIATLCEQDADTAPTLDGDAILDKHAEVWKLSDQLTVVDRTSEHSLLPRLASWKTSEGVAGKILYSIECDMRGCRYTLGLGEPNLLGKPSLRYDEVCRPSDLHRLEEPTGIDNHENKILQSTLQILESWIAASLQILKRVYVAIGSRRFEEASRDCWILQRIWILLLEVEDLHLLMDPEDFLVLKGQLGMRSGSGVEGLCFRSEGLVEMTRMCMDLKHSVPEILEVEVDPMGGPIIQEAAMDLYGRGKREGFHKIHLLQGMQSIEAVLKRFFYSYSQVASILMGSVELNRSSGGPLSRIFLEPTYFPSLDAAKTFIGIRNEALEPANVC